MKNQQADFSTRPRSVKPDYSPERVKTHNHAHARIKAYFRAQGPDVYTYRRAEGEYNLLQVVNRAKRSVSLVRVFAFSKAEHDDLLIHMERVQNTAADILCFHVVDSGKTFFISKRKFLTLLPESMNRSVPLAWLERYATERTITNAVIPQRKGSVDFITRAETVKRARDELRERCRKSPGFLRLLRKAAAEQLKGARPVLTASTPAATRALEYAVCKLRMQTEVNVPEGVAARPVYLMREETEHGRPWTEVSKRRAVFAMKQTTPDTLAVSKVWVYSPTISHRAARKLDALTAPEEVTIDDHILTWEDTRQIESAHFTDDRGVYDDAGNLVHPDDAGEQEERPETWEEAWRPLPLKEKVARRAPTPAREVPEAPFYHATQTQTPRWAQLLMDAEQDAHKERKEELARDDEEAAADGAESILELLREQLGEETRPAIRAELEAEITHLEAQRSAEEKKQEGIRTLEKAAKK